MVRPGDVLAEKYRLVGLLGEGGMGAVFEAEHLEIGKRVAVKVLHPEVARNSEALARFTREARAAAAIGHIAIIDVYDIGTAEDGSLFLVMESLEGETLAELIQRQGSVEVPLAAYVTCQVLSGLAAAHGKGIVHRDLKPENVFLVRTGQSLPGVKLLDFGISKMVDPLRPDEKLTRTGMVMGTPYYMAPEQAVGRTDLDGGVDIYAVGVMLYETLTSRVPFNAENTLALIQKILNDAVTPPREVRPDLPAPLQDVVLRAMARDRDARFPTATEMLAELLPFVDDQAAALVPLPRGVEHRASTHGGEDPALASTSTALPATPDKRPETKMAWTGRHPTTRSRRRLAGGLGALVTVVVIGAVAVAWSLGVGADDSAGSPAGGPIAEPAALAMPVDSPQDNVPLQARTPDGAPPGASDAGADSAADVGEEEAEVEPAATPAVQRRVHRIHHRREPQTPETAPPREDAREEPRQVIVIREEPTPVEPAATPEPAPVPRELERRTKTRSDELESEFR